MKQKLLVLGGPTAVGKTELSIKLASELNGEIISADSMQIYKYMDIGSAKVTEEEMDGVKHHLIDVIEPDVPFSVADFKEYGDKAIKEIISQNKFPIIAGGTGLYINSLTCNMTFTEAEKDDEYRLELEKLCEEKGNDYVHEMLKDIDPVSYREIHANNRKRVIRALEVYKLTGKPFSSYNAGEDFYKSDYDVYYYVLTMNREKLYERINKRVDIMMENGLIEEVKKLLNMGYDKDLISMQGIGYKEIVKYLEGEYTLDEAVEIIKRDSRRYAKRQITWFKRYENSKWFDLDKYDDKEILKKEILDYIENISKNV